MPTGFSATWVDLVLLALFVLFAFVGWRSGLVRMAFRLGSFLAAVILARLLAPVLTAYLQSTAFYRSLLAGFSPNTAESGALAGQIGEELAAYGARTVLNILSFALAFGLVRILLALLCRALNLVTSLPVLGFLNRLAGMALGLVEGFALCLVLLAILHLAAPLGEEGGLAQAVEDSALAGPLYQDNPILRLLPSQEAPAETPL